jgi:hypothetical protein
MLLTTRALIAAAILASALLFTSPSYPAVTEPGVARMGTGKCDPKKSKRIETVLPCAWDEARRQMREKYPSWSDDMRRLKRPKINFRQGGWYDEELGDYVVGDTDPDGDPPIQIGLVGDAEFDYETTVHEFKHYIVDQLRLGEEAHRWIDSDDDDQQH